MTKYLGPFAFLLAFNCFAGETSAFLHLRAIVPAVTKVEIQIDQSGPKAILRSNHTENHKLPKLQIQKNAIHYVVSVTQP